MKTKENNYIEVEGMEKLFNNLDNIEKKFENEMERIINLGAEIIKNDAKSKAPRESGHLADSIEVHTLEVEKNHIKIGVGPVGDNVFYWYFVEFGTYRSNAKPYLRPAFEQNKRKAKKIIAKGINALLEKAGI